MGIHFFWNTEAMGDQDALTKTKTSRRLLRWISSINAEIVPGAEGRDSGVPNVFTP
jgi:hypothetical protein